jgi:hypothetical protein
VLTQQPKGQLHNKHDKRKEKTYKETKEGNLYRLENKNISVSALTPVMCAVRKKYVHKFIFNTSNI